MDCIILLREGGGGWGRREGGRTLSFVNRAVTVTTTSGVWLFQESGGGGVVVVQGLPYLFMQGNRGYEEVISIVPKATERPIVFVAFGGGGGRRIELLCAEFALTRCIIG